MKITKNLGVLVSVLMAAFAVISIFFPYRILNGRGWSNNKIYIGKYNDFADFVSGVSSPFLSLAAFLLLYLTYHSQKRELENSGKLLEEQRKIMEKQNQSMEIQSKTSQLQQFETTFFNLLNLHHEITNNIILKMPEKQRSGPYTVKKIEIPYNGRNAFKEYFDLLKKEYNSVRSEDSILVVPIDKEHESDIIVRAYEQFFLENQSELGHYFRNLYHIVKLISRSNVNDKQHYASLVRAQLSTYEMLLLFYNCLTPYGKKFKRYIEDYHLLKGVYDEEFFQEVHEQLYNSSAFKGSRN